MRRVVLAFALALAAVPARAEPMAVVASFSLLADIVRTIGGERVAVHALVGPDRDAHVYQPTPADSRTVAQARVVTINGLGFEGWIERLIKASGTRAEVVVATTGIATRAMTDGHGHAHRKGADPHVWHDPRRMAVYAKNLAEGLATADPAGAETYRANAAAFGERARALDAWAEAAFAKVPAAKRKVITGHDAFGYLAERYGLTLRSPRGVSTDSEPSAKGIAALIRQIRGEKIRAIFIENIADRRLVDQLAREAGAVVGGRLYSDALSGPEGPAASYETLFRTNVTLLTSAMLQN
ncbi:MAG: metal ABC transporter substrate-binding protein [Alphaproteobacteria bacterium]|nr:metal ABC transporter substrate-binding protein [Alphaproteobacteria bacterium]